MTECNECGEPYPRARARLGYTRCIHCAEARPERVVRTVVPGHKQAYFLCTNLEDLKGINNKGGQVRF